MPAVAAVTAKTTTAVTAAARVRTAAMAAAKGMATVAVMDALRAMLLAMWQWRQWLP